MSTAFFESPTRMPKEFEQLAEHVGEFMQYWGFKKIHGQIWMHIYLSEDPIDATTLVKRLKVSKALVSLAVKDLLHYNVILVDCKGNKRTLYLRANPDLMKVITDVMRNRERVMMDNVKKSLSSLKALSKEERGRAYIHPERLKDLEEMVCSASDALDLMIHSELSKEIFKTP
ncbi:MAG: GbsR/MarR family transcriptional regulator [Pseudobdellovibrionaceae bacterium]|jgi:DNA-binding transcriptional regulator GbsR (MarR family)